MSEIREVRIAYERPKWHALAACRGTDPNLFFPERGDHLSVAAAKAVCAECPVSIECMTFAVVNAERAGVWGGTTSKTRAWLANLTRKVAS